MTDCPECWGTGFFKGWGVSCSKGCSNEARVELPIPAKLDYDLGRGLVFVGDRQIGTCEEFKIHVGGKPQKTLVSRATFDALKKRGLDTEDVSVYGEDSEG